MSFSVPEKYRLITGPIGSKPNSGNNGFFVFKKNQTQYRAQASDGGGWEHVSVSLDRKRCPDWEEMCMVKDLFWDEEDCVVQFHPPKSEYVSFHPYCLHLWRMSGENFKTPPSIFVGPK